MAPKLGIQAVVRRNLEAYTQVSKRRRLTDGQFEKLVSAIPSFVSRLPARAVPPRGKRTLPKGAAYGWDYGVPELPGSAVRVILLAPAATPQQLKALRSIIERTWRLLESIKATGGHRTEVESALQHLETAHTKLSARLALGVETHRGGQRPDSNRRLMLERLASLFIQLRIPLTTTPDGAFPVVARTLLGVQAIHHSDLMDAKRQAQQSRNV